MPAQGDANLHCVSSSEEIIQEGKRREGCITDMLRARARPRTASSSTIVIKVGLVAVGTFNARSSTPFSRRFYALVASLLPMISMRKALQQAAQRLKSLLDPHCTVHERLPRHNIRPSRAHESSDLFQV